jgi:hypothetical protein
MFKELISNGNGGYERPELNGAYIGKFLGVKEKQRPTFETRLSPEPTLEDVFVFEFEIDDADGLTSRCAFPSGCASRRGWRIRGNLER